MSDQDSFYRMDVALWQVANRVRKQDAMTNTDFMNFLSGIRDASAILKRYDPNTTAIVDETSEEFGAVIDRHHESSTE